MIGLGIVSYKSVNISSAKEDNRNLVSSINIETLQLKLIQADKELTPIKHERNGDIFYTYKNKPGDKELSISEIKQRIRLGSDFYINERQKINNILRRLNELGINNKLVFLNNGAHGLWDPSKITIYIDKKVIEKGSPTFLDVLRHEIIHVSQSCFNGSKNSFPKRIGLPLKFSKRININLSHNVYNRNPKEINFLEREAFSYSQIDGAALKLLNKFCG